MAGKGVLGKVSRCFPGRRLLAVIPAPFDRHSRASGNPRQATGNAGIYRAAAAGWAAGS